MKQLQEEKLKLFKLVEKFAYSYRHTPFTLASGKTSNHYFNCKNITLYPDRLKILTDYLVGFHIGSFISLGEKSIAIGGLTMGSDPICYSVSLSYNACNKKVFPLIVRKETKSHGMKRMVEGAFEEDIEECIIVDDVITTGDSTIQAIKAISDLDIKIKTGFCIIDREEGGCQSIKKDFGVDIFPIFKKTDFFKK